MRHLLRLWPAFLLVMAVAVVVALNLIAANAVQRSQQESYPGDNYSYIENGLCLGGMLSEPPDGIRAVLNVGETRAW